MFPRLHYNFNQISVYMFNRNLNSNPFKHEHVSFFLIKDMECTCTKKLFKPANEIGNVLNAPTQLNSMFSKKICRWHVCKRCISSLEPKALSDQILYVVFSSRWCTFFTFSHLFPEQKVAVSPKGR